MQQFDGETFEGVQERFPAGGAHRWARGGMMSPT
jgi:hypothetical protein